jgi:hypothetical protein
MDPECRPMLAYNFIVRNNDANEIEKLAGRHWPTTATRSPLASRSSEI